MPLKNSSVLVASPELRALTSKAAHIPWGLTANLASAVLNNRKVMLHASLVERRTLDGPVLVLCLRSQVDGKWVSRRQLLELTSKNASASPPAPELSAC
jgi:hypothetical protein